MLQRPLLTALAAGLLSATGFAPLEWWPVLLACLAALLWLVHEAPSLRAAVLRGWLFGVGHFTVGNNWIQHAFDYQDKMPPALGYFAVVALALFLALYPALAMGLAWAFARRVPARAGWKDADIGFVLAAAAAWMLGEWLRGALFTGYPWDPLGVAWVPVRPIAALAALTGTYALSGLTIVFAGALFLLTRFDYRLLAASAAALAVGLMLPASVPETAGQPLVRIVQPNIGQEGVEAPDYAERALARLIALSGAPGARPRLVVWPEGMVNQLVEDGYPPQWYGRQQDPRVVRARIAAVLGPRDRALIGGNALFFDRRDLLAGAGNSVWVIDPDGMLGERYDKAHLVPYGEYLPLRALLAPLGLARLVMGDTDFVPGPGPRTLAVPGFGQAGVQICYEIIFSGEVVDRAHRPDFLFNPSNDAWFGRWGPVEHLAQARMRAIEEGLPILRATPTGVSAVIDARGRLLATVPPGQAGAIELPLPRALAPTWFARVGHWMTLLVGALLLLLGVANRRFAR
ncbi:MAG: apolipoprotein N-acyltransferase [Sphingomonas sp.]